jgi:hypothetical protein
MRRLVLFAGVVAVLSLAAARPARAQAFSRLEPGQKTVTVETGLQSAVVTSVGAAAGLRWSALDRTLMPFVQATMPVARPDLGDYAGRAGAQMSLLTLGWLDLSAQLAFDVAGTQNSITSATALRTDTVLLLGHYGRSWFTVAEAGYDHTWATYIKATDYYRTYFYADAKDGWYSNTAGALHGGLKGGLTVGAIELVLRAGVTKSERLADLDLPFYAMLGAGYRF